MLDPCHEPLAAETLEWAGTVWAESLFASNLAVAGADFDQFGECGGGQALEEGKVVELPRVTLLKPTVDGAHASGRWEDDAGGGGAFELTMSDDGRAFAGTLSDADGGASRAWSGLRKPKPKPAARGRRRLPATRAVAPPSPRALAARESARPRALPPRARRRRRRRRRRDEGDRALLPRAERLRRPRGGARRRRRRRRGG